MKMLVFCNICQKTKMWQFFLLKVYDKIGKEWKEKRGIHDGERLGYISSAL